MNILIPENVIKRITNNDNKHKLKEYIQTEIQLER